LIYLNRMMMHGLAEFKVDILLWFENMRENYNVFCIYINP